jgi:hypothetical protein
MAKAAIAKKIVYLWGAGATHAEAQRLGSAVSLLMRDTEDFGEGITTRILKRTGARAVASFGAGPGVDIEKLISLLVASGEDEHVKLAEKMRLNYFMELRSSLAKGQLLNDQHLAVALLRMHRDATFRSEAETLSGIITTNHDGLLQVACQRVFGGINPGFEFDSDFFERAPSAEVPPILQLHGSFTWQFGLPIRIEKLGWQSPYPGTVWIPPTILKESKSYPFNKLTGRAYELLSRQCDVLRVVGTSLTQNDWNILSLIFNAQRHREATKGEAFQIELIMPHKTGEGIRTDCAYLKNMRPIGYLTDGRFADYKRENFAIPPESDMANPFAYWLTQKSEFHCNRRELDSLGETRVGVLIGVAS